MRFREFRVANSQNCKRFAGDVKQTWPDRVYLQIRDGDTIRALTHRDIAESAEGLAPRIDGARYLPRRSSCAAVREPPGVDCRLSCGSAFRRCGGAGGFFDAACGICRDPANGTRLAADYHTQISGGGEQDARRHDRSYDAFCSMSMKMCPLGNLGTARAWCCRSLHRTMLGRRGRRVRPPRPPARRADR